MDNLSNLTTLYLDSYTHPLRNILTKFNNLEEISLLKDIEINQQLGQIKRLVVNQDKFKALIELSKIWKIFSNIERIITCKRFRENKYKELYYDVKTRKYYLQSYKYKYSGYIRHEFNTHGQSEYRLDRLFFNHEEYSD